MNPRQLRQILVDLGSTTAEVARSLEALGVHGLPQDAESCPLANYLKGVVPPELTPVVGDGYVDLMDNIDDARRTPVVSVPLPGPCCGLVHDFDMGLYQALLDPKLREEDPS